MRRLFFPRRNPFREAPHIFKYEGIWDCGFPGTIRGFGNTAEEAYADWRHINVEKGRIDDDTTKWPLPRKNHDRRGGSR